MKSRWLVVVLLALLAAVAAVFLEPTGVVRGYLAGESFFQSRPSSYWRDALCADPATREDALEALEQGGEPAVAVLVELLTTDSSAEQAEVRWTAAEVLGRLGPAAESAGPALLAALDDADPHVRAVAATALPAVGVRADAAVPALIELLAGDQKIVAARVLSEYRAAAKPALSELATVLGDHSLDSETRWNAARTLGKLGPDGVAAIPILVECLDDEAPTVREHAAEALGDIGPPAAATVPDLISVLDDPATRVRRDAVRSLGYLGEASRPAVPHMLRLLSDPEAIVRDAARNALAAVAPHELPVEAPRPVGGS